MVMGGDRRYISGKDMVVTFMPEWFTVRANYKYGWDGDISDRLVNAKTVFKRSAITSIGIAWDDEGLVYYISFKGAGIDKYINLESAEKANELLEVFTEWWLK